MPITKEKTALIPFVGANGGQSSQISTDPSIPESNGNYNENFEISDDKGKPSIIDGLLYDGVYILAGAPKIGKSFMVLVWK